VRDNARTGFQLRHELGTKLLHEIRQNIERHHRGFADISFEHVLFNELNAIADAVGLRLFVGQVHQLRIDVDADALALKLRAAVIIIRPSPEPRSMTKSFAVTPAILSISSTTICGVGT
jgi:hypothetical protein